MLDLLADVKSTLIDVENIKTNYWLLIIIVITNMSILKKKKSNSANPNLVVFEVFVILPNNLKSISIK